MRRSCQPHMSKKRTRATRCGGGGGAAAPDGSLEAMVLGDELTRTLSVESGGHSSGSEQAPDPKTARTGEASPVELSNSDIRCTFCNKPKKHYPKLKYRTCRVSAYSDTVDKNFAERPAYRV